MYKNWIISGFLAFIVMSSCHEESKSEPTKREEIKETKLPAKEEVKEVKKEVIIQSNVKEKLSTYFKENKERVLLIKTNFGDIKIRLYEGTPLHSANFLMLAKRNYFDSTKFYRVFDKFMIQGGNSDDDGITMKMAEIGHYKIPNEINMSKYYHKRGAVAMAVGHYEQMQGEKMSSPFNFYIITGQKLPKSYLKDIETDNNITFENHHIQTYTTMGGAAHLDGDYTVFGEVIEGMNVAEKISKVKTIGEERWPAKPAYIIHVEVIE